MMRALMALVVLPIVVFAQQTHPLETSAFRARIQAEDSTKSTTVHVRVQGDFRSVSIRTSRGGFAHMTGDSTLASTPFEIELATGGVDVTLGTSDDKQWLVLTADLQRAGQANHVMGKANPLMLKRTYPDGIVRVFASWLKMWS